jgi:enoyl-CoA hydratase
VAEDFAEDFGGGDEIRFERRGAAGLITLTRPKAMNAVTHRMVLALERALDAWRDDPHLKAVIVMAEGKAFSAGGDIVDIYNAGKAGKPPIQFFADEYRLNAKIRAWPKPYVAIIDGIAMGGGVGVSYHGSHRVVTENAIFAMPECGIGFFPDVGGSYILPRLKGAYGLYLGLTGARVKRGDQCWSGLATHAVNAAIVPTLVDALVRGSEVDETLAVYALKPERETDEALIHALNIHFSLGSVPDIVASLMRVEQRDEFARETLAALRTKSPTSMLVAFAQIAAGAMLSMDDCMRMEFRIVSRMLAGKDFYEGIRAAVIDKDRTPRWAPGSLAEVSPEAVQAYFAPLPGGELVL